MAGSHRGLCTKPPTQARAIMSTLLRLKDVAIGVEQGGPAGGLGPLLLVHGWLGTRHTWADLVPGLRMRHRTMEVDLRGHGTSSVPATGYGTPDMAADLAEVIELIDGGPVTVMAHSMGTSVATRLAVDRPELVSALVLVDPDYGGDPTQRASLQAMAELPDDEQVKAAVADIFVNQIDAHTRSASLRDAHLRGVREVPARVVAATLQALINTAESIRFRTQAEALLPHRRQPTLSFHRAFERAEWERLHAVHPASRAILVSGAGHWIHEEQPALVVDETERWLTHLHSSVGAPAPSKP